MFVIREQPVSKLRYSLQSKITFYSFYFYVSAPNSDLFFMNMKLFLLVSLLAETWNLFQTSRYFIHHSRLHVCFYCVWVQTTTCVTTLSSSKLTWRSECWLLVVVTFKDVKLDNSSWAETCKISAVVFKPPETDLGWGSCFWFWFLMIL